MRPLEMVMAMALAAGTAPASVSFVLDGTGGVIVPVTVGGLQDLRFLLDTGSTRSVVSEPVAQRLSLRAVARTEMVTTAGVSMAVVAALPPTCLATQCIDDALAIVTNNALDFGSGQLGGILGGDILNRGDFTIDYTRRRFEWGGGTDERRHDDRLPMSVEDGRPIVTLPQAGGRSLRLVADSGADAFVLFDSQLVRSLSRIVDLNHFTLRTLGGNRRAQPVTLPSLRVGAATWRDEIATVVPRPDGYPEDIDGLMPLHRLASVSFRRTESAIIVRHRSS
jgi:predicted aspartyl protease